MDTTSKVTPICCNMRIPFQKVYEELLRILQEHDFSQVDEAIWEKVLGL